MRKSNLKAPKTSPKPPTWNNSNDTPCPSRTWTEINLTALHHNLKTLEKHASSLAGRPIQSMAILKADAYGHGLETIAKSLAPFVRFFGVACPREALLIHSLNLNTPIFLLGPTLPAEASLVTHHRFIPSISSTTEADTINNASNPAHPPLPVHIVIDTGMGRIGALTNETLPLIHHIHQHCPHLLLDGIASHYPSADEDHTFTRKQTELFDSLLDNIAQQFPLPPQIHLANSAGILTIPSRHATLVRPGLALFGQSPINHHQPSLIPVLSLKSKITLVRNLPPGSSISYGRTVLTHRKPHTRIATIALGYADGLPRSLSGNHPCVLIHGQRCPILGRITMDQILADTTNLPHPPSPGDEAVIIGSQGNESILVSEIAAKAGTIPWEILTNLSNPRLSRQYLT